MRHTIFRALMPIGVLLLSPGCATAPTPPSIARTERPSIPAPPTELRKTETLRHIENTGADPGDYPVAHAEAAGAVERLNNRINGWRAWAACVRYALSKGASPDECTGEKE